MVMASRATGVEVVKSEGSGRGPHVDYLLLYTLL